MYTACWWFGRRNKVVMLHLCERLLHDFSREHVDLLRYLTSTARFCLHQEVWSPDLRVTVVRKQANFIHVSRRGETPNEPVSVWSVWQGSHWYQGSD